MKFQSRLTLFFMLLLSGLTACSQQTLKTYSAEWKKAEEFTRKGLPQSALEEVNKIYKMAKNEKQDAQIVKALVHRLSLQSEIREDYHETTIATLKEEIATAKEPARSIMHTLLAEAYLNQYQSLRWQLMSRTDVAGIKPDDPSSWSAADFMETVTIHFRKSLENESLLKGTALDALDAIVIKGNVRNLRPTLFDLLAHRALAFFSSDERTLQKPAYVFEIDQEEAFAPATAFAAFDFQTRDSLSLEHKALRLYQELLLFHRERGNNEALIDADIQRLSFVYRKSVHPDKDQLYTEALTRIADEYAQAPASAQASYLLASWYYQQSRGYEPYGDTTHRYSAVKALEIADKIIARFPESEGGTGLYNLRQGILTPSLNFTVEKVNVPAKPFRISLQYKNQRKVYFRIVRSTDALRSIGLREGQEKLRGALGKELTVKKWEQDLPETGDYQAHRAELPVEALPVGEYYLIVSGSASSGVSPEALRAFYVSDISFVSQGTDYFVLHRDAGYPLEGAKVQVWNQRYTSNGYQREKKESYTTDKNGYFKLRGSKVASNIQLELSYQNDRLQIDEQQFLYATEADGTVGKAEKTMFFFTDRSIYRPGQSLYFKGILLTKMRGQVKSEIVSGNDVTVDLLDANGQKVDSLRLVSNEYGSVSGVFQLPSTGLNGNFHIAAAGIGGAAHFNVEEYKRPKYKVEIEKPQHAYKVNEAVKVMGYAKAFAGNSIDGAAVKYRVERVARFPYPWLFWRGWFPASPPMQIAHGETVTDREGRFEVRFTAIPDRKISPAGKPVFDYVVYADVTDGSGETRSASQTVSVSYQPVVLIADIPGQFDKDSLPTINIRTENTNGVFVPTGVRVTVRKLKPEMRLIRERLWTRPDQFVLSKTAFVDMFPNDVYDNENAPEAWERGDIVWSGEKGTQADGKWALDALWESGFYEVEIVATVEDSEPVRDVRRVEVTDENAGELARPNYLWTKGSKPVEPGGSAVISLGTAAEEVFLIQAEDRQKGSNQRSERSYIYRFLKKSRGVDRYRFDATEEDRGGYGMGFLFVKHNRVYQFQDVVKVPWSNKELEISYGTYRDKTLPGSKETWTLTVSGQKGEKAVTELLAAMYDASLDEFMPNQWQRPAIWPEYWASVRWADHLSFATVLSFSFQGRLPKSKQYEKNYDRLISLHHLLDEVVTGYGGRKARSMRSEVMLAAPSVMAESADMAVLQKAEGVTEASVATGNGILGGTPADQPVRSDFRETAFFFPALTTGVDGSVTFSFTMPEALTKWRFQAFSHTRELALGYSSREIVTQKELMVQPNIPRFVRTGDRVAISARLVNLSESALQGATTMSVIDAATGVVLDREFGLTKTSIPFEVAAGESIAVHFPLTIPESQIEPVTFRITAKAGQFSDGEDNITPVLTNRMLVTETLPLSMKGTGSRTFTFDKLVKSGSGTTLKNHGLTIEYTANPAWYAVQALPYLMEYPYDCAEQTWNRYYANALATHIAHSTPRIDQLFKTWRDLDTSALLSNLQKNQELKSLLLEETPWVLAAKSEAEQKRNLGLLFDLVRMKGESEGSLDKLQKMQRPEGGFPWFSGGPDDRYVTQYIVTGIGHLYHLSKLLPTRQPQLDAIVSSALGFLDRQLAKDYEQLVRSKTDLKKYVPSPVEIQYFYMRSFFPAIELPGPTRKAYSFYRERVAATWVGQNKYLQAMTALALFRGGEKTVAAAVMKSLKETAIRHEELGMYWKNIRRTWWWQEAPIEQHALLVEAFDEVSGDNQTADEIRTWLLTNKRTNHWESTKATAEACYALLLRGSEWLNDIPEVTITLGETVLDASSGTEAGTGYFKKQLSSNDVKPGHGHVQVAVNSTSDKVGNRPSWGGIYWQYFEDLDKITFSETPLKLKKQLFIERDSDRGPVLKPLDGGTNVKVGERLKVRIELTVDRDMEYVHMKDMRASALEPVNVLSGYKWQGGLGYYETTKDAVTHFFFNFLPKGKYVFEYPLNVSHAGDFSNGVTTIQCMYAPEFTAHSEGVRLKVTR